MEMENFPVRGIEAETSLAFSGLIPRLLDLLYEFPKDKATLVTAVGDVTLPSINRGLVLKLPEAPSDEENGAGEFNSPEVFQKWLALDQASVVKIQLE